MTDGVGCGRRGPQPAPLYVTASGQISAEPLPRGVPGDDDGAVAADGAVPGRVIALPSGGTVLEDARGESRWMRVTWHDDEGVVVLSVWRDGSCVATVRLERGDVPALVTALVDGLAETTPAPGW